MSKMEVGFNYVLSQIFTILVYVLVARTYFLKNKRKIVITSTLSLVVNIVVYALLNAWTGLAMCVVAMLRNFYILREEKEHGKRKKIEKRDYAFLVMVYLGIVLATIPTYRGFFSLLSVFATSIYTFAIWQKSTKVYKFCGILIGLLWIAYNVYIQSIFGTVLETILLVVSTVGYVAEMRRGRNKVAREGQSRSYALSSGVVSNEES